MPLYSLVPSFRPLLAPVPRLRLRTDTHTHTHTHTQTDRQTHTQDNYRNPPAHARQGLMTLELNDILFFIKSMKSNSDHFNIKSFFSFHCSSTRSSSQLKLKHSLSKLNKTRHFYFNRFPRLWNSLPVIDINLSMSTISSHLKVFFWSHFLSNFNTELPKYHFICPCNKCCLIPTKCLFTTSLSEYIHSSQP